MKNVRELGLGELIREAIFGYDAGSGPAARAELDRREREEYRRTGPSVAQLIEEKASKKIREDVTETDGGHVSRFVQQLTVATLALRKIRDGAALSRKLADEALVEIERLEKLR